MEINLLALFFYQMFHIYYENCNISYHSEQKATIQNKSFRKFDVLRGFASITYNSNKGNTELRQVDTLYYFYTYRTQSKDLI